VLESLHNKGWVKVYSGEPLFFKAVEPASVFDKVKDYALLLESVQLTLKGEVNGMKEKFVIRRFDVGLEGLNRKLLKQKQLKSTTLPQVFLRR
jgi:hypothetical protein